MRNLSTPGRACVNVGAGTRPSRSGGPSEAFVELASVDVLREGVVVGGTGAAGYVGRGAVRCRFHSADRPDRVSRGLRRTLWFLTAATVTAALVTGAASSRTAGPGSPGGGGAGEVAIFYYPWYGTVAVDGSWQHWQQNGNDPPASIASNWFPRAWGLLLVRRGRRARADARDRVDRRADRDRLVVGAGVDGGRSASPRRAGCPRRRAAGRATRRAVRRTNARERSSRSCAPLRQRA